MGKMICECKSIEMWRCVLFLYVYIYKTWGECAWVGEGAGGMKRRVYYVSILCILLSACDFCRNTSRCAFRP